MKACKVTIQILFSEGNFHKNNQGLLVILKKLRHDFFLYVYGLFGEKKIKKSPSIFRFFPKSRTVYCAARPARAAGTFKFNI